MRRPLRIYRFEPHLMLAGVFLGLPVLAWSVPLGTLLLLPVVSRLAYIVMKG